MDKGVYKQILNEVFDVLELSEPGRDLVLDSFKNRLALGLLESLKNELPQDKKEWIEKNMNTAHAGDKEIEEIQKIIAGLYSKEAMQEKSRPIFEKLLREYIEFVTKESGLSFEKANKLNALAESFQ